MMIKKWYIRYFPASIPTTAYYLVSSSISAGTIRRRSCGGMPAQAVGSSSCAAISSTNTRPTFSWCCTASLQQQQGDSHEVIINNIAGYHQDNNNVNSCWLKEIDDRSLDLTEISGWFEFLERSENRMNDEGGAGAYDTLRCDMNLHPTADCSSRQDEDRWRKWGLDYHLHRLQNSYRSLLSENNGGSSSSSGGTKQHDEAIKQAVTESHLVLEELLSQAERSTLLISEETSSTKCRSDDVMIQLIRLTLLWSPSLTAAADEDEDSTTSCNKVIVRGHACSSAKAVQVHRPVQPITVSVAAVGHHRHNCTSSSDVIEVDQSLPTRYLDPQNKISSWTRLRKQMESPTYKPPGCSEVLMVKPGGGGKDDKSSSELEVLEGLSSNFFVVYKNGTIRTAQNGVLFGYVRHLVLDSLRACGLELDPNPILLHEARDGPWKEAFITSSSRLIFPISKILVHTDDGENFEEYWSDPVLVARDRAHISTDDEDNDNDNNDDDLLMMTDEKPKWQQLLDEIMRKGGYPPLVER